MKNQTIEQAVVETSRHFCNGIALQLKPSNAVMEAIRLLNKELPQALTAEREAGARAEAEWWSNHAQKLSAAIESSKDIVDAERLGLKYAKKHVARLKALTPPTK